jgi:hypothetical protein
MSDPSVRQLTTEHEKTLKLAPDMLCISGKQNGLSLLDKTGLQIQSGLPIQIVSKKGISFQAKNITVNCGTEFSAHKTNAMSVFHADGTNLSEFADNILYTGKAATYPKLPQMAVPSPPPFDWGGLGMKVLAGLAVVALVAGLAAYGASIVATGGASALAAPAVGEAAAFAVGGITAMVGAGYVANQASKDIANRKVSGLDAYVKQGLIGSGAGVVEGSVWAVCAPAGLAAVAGTAFIGGFLGDTTGQLLGTGKANPNQAMKDAAFQALIAGGAYGLGLLCSAVYKC